MTDHANTILVVDDDALLLGLMVCVLGDQYNVITAENGPEALEALKHHDISLIMSDQNMPGMTGLELLRASRIIDPDVVRMLVTAVTDNDTSIKAINDAGVVRVIHKPWDWQLVLQFVEEALARRQVLLECRQSNARIEQVMSDLRRDAESLNSSAKRLR